MKIVKRSGLGRAVIVAITLLLQSVGALMLSASPAFADTTEERRESCDRLVHEASRNIFNPLNPEYTRSVDANILRQMNELDCEHLPPRPKVATPVTLDPSKESLVLQGRYAEDGIYGPVDIGKAIGFYTESCNANQSRGCYYLGEIIFTGKGTIAGNSVTQNKQAAASLFSKSCELGATEGCFSLGAMAENGDGIAEDKVRAAKLYGKACDLNWMDGCAALGTMAKLGFGGLAPDKARALQLYQKSCSGDGNRSNVGCYNLGIVTIEGDGVPPDSVRAVALFTYSCDTQFALGCFNLGLLYENGTVVKKDKKRAIKLFNRTIGLDPSLIKANEHLKKLGAKTCDAYDRKKFSELTKFLDAGCMLPKK
jgi:TPR repeat protein